MLADSLKEVQERELQLKALPTVARFESISVVIPEHQEENLRTIRKDLALKFFLTTTCSTCRPRVPRQFNMK